MSGQPHLTVLVADEHPLTAEVRGLLAEWVRLGLLAPGALWCSGVIGDVVELTADGEQSRDLQSRLAQLEVGFVRLLSVQVVGADDVGAGVPLATQSMREFMENVLSPTQTLVSVNAIVPAPGLSLSAVGCIDTGARANIVISPEDRRTERTATIDLNSSDHLVAHAALAVATVGALWPGMEEGPFDQRTVGVSGDGRHVIAARSAGRVLLCEDIVEELLEQLFARRNQGDLDPEIVAAEPAANPRRLGTDVATSVLSSEGVRYVARQAEAPPPAQSIGLRQAFVSMNRHLWGRLRSAPRRFVDRGSEELRTQVESMAQKFVFGNDSMMRIQGAGATGSDHALDVEALQSAAERLAASWSDEQRVMATPDVWRALRESAFAIVDGSSLPSELRGVSDERLVVSRDLWAAVPDPRDPSLTVRIPGVKRAGRVELSACDPRTAIHAVDQLGSIASGKSPTSASSSDAATSEQRKAIAEEATETLGEVGDWVDRRQGGMLWEFGRQLDTELARATRAFKTSFDRAQAEFDAPDEQGFKRARRKLRLWWSLVTVLLVLFVLGGVRGLGANARGTPGLAYFAVVFLVALLGLTLAYLGFERRLFQLSHRYNVRLIEHRNALMAVQHDAREVARLKALYEQYKDWSGIVGWVVHHPEGTETAVVPEAELPDLAHPESLRVATGRPSDDFAEHLVARTARRVFGRGWLTGLYGRTSQEAMARYRLRRGLSSSASMVDPDHDTAETGARRFLLDELQDGDLASSWRREVRRTLTQEFSAIPPTELFDQVSELSSDNAGSEATDTARFFASLLPSGSSAPEFPPGLWTPNAVVDRRHSVDQVLIWAPSGMLTPNGASNVVMHETRTQGEDGPLRVRALRLDLTAECDPRSLKCFAGDVVATGSDASGFSIGDIG